MQVDDWGQPSVTNVKMEPVDEPVPIKEEPKINEGVKIEPTASAGPPKLPGFGKGKGGGKGVVPVEPSSSSESVKAEEVPVDEEAPKPKKQATGWSSATGTKPKRKARW